MQFDAIQPGGSTALTAREAEAVQLMTRYQQADAAAATAGRRLLQVVWL